MMAAEASESQAESESDGHHDSDATVIATVAVVLYYAAIMIPYAGPAAIYDCILRVWHTRIAYVPARPVRRQVTVSIQVSKLVSLSAY